MNGEQLTAVLHMFYIIIFHYNDNYFSYLLFLLETAAAENFKALRKCLRKWNENV